MANERSLGSEGDADMLPVVAGAAPGNWGMWAFFAILAIGGIWLFTAMSANRVQLQAPATTLQGADGGGRITAGPPLAERDVYFLGPRLEPERRIAVRGDTAPIFPAPSSRPAPAAPRNINPAPAQIFPADYPRGNLQPPGPSVVFDSAFSGQASGSAQSQTSGQDRVTAGRFENPSRTIPQGTVIPAVLETALDSTRPGAARALVQRSVYSFDGTRILIQRGSRLYGEYDSGLEAGQNRALIQWTRLIRPDGVTIALNSPSSDPLGRAGVKGDVDSKFLQRFGGAILQSVLDIGVGVATREASSDGVIVALPGSTQNLQVNDQQRVQRTLKIRHGTSVSVFVARDLDFSTVEF